MSEAGKDADEFLTVYKSREVRTELVWSIESNGGVETTRVLRRPLH